MRTLVLNADFIPLNLVPLSTVTWQEAMCLWTQDKAVPVAYHNGKVVHSPSKTFQVPSVLLLKGFKQYTKYAKWSKRNVKVRDGFHCQYCGKKFSENSLTIDHVMPKARGGDSSWENTVAACKPCNAKKKDELKMRPIKAATRPTYYQLAKMLLEKERIKHPEWAEYMRI